MNRMDNEHGKDGQKYAIGADSAVCFHGEFAYCWF